MPVMPVNSPRSRNGTRSAVTMLVMDVIPPPPTPCIAMPYINTPRPVRTDVDKDAPRPTMSMSMLFAAPDTADPTAKTVSAPIIVSRRPNICASLPLNGRHAAAARLYADATHEKSCPSRSLTIVGAAVPTAPCATRGCWLGDGCGG